ncbi:MAG: calcium/sodium antiporter [Lachnospiraceae bacterium]|nr:calcium/sodium antiporter [Lachnospiraceae bacterium]
MVLQFVLLVVGFVLLMKGADWFVDGASKIADKFGIPHIVIGLTIVAFGTSAPEAAVSISAALKGSVDLAISNVLGSNIMNVLLILGLSSIIYPLAVKKSAIKFDIPFVFAVSVLMLVCGAIDGNVGRIDGLIFWVLLVGYIIYMIRLTKKSQESDEDFEPADDNDKIWKLLLLIIVGGVMIVAGSNVTVDAASNIATEFGMDDRLIGLTIVAFGTSLPELVTSCIAAKKKETDIAVGNIVGSNLFNILFVLGTSAVITPIEYKSDFIFDNVVAILVMVVLWLFVFRKQKLSRAGGVIMLVLYAAYFVNLLYQALNPAAIQ